MAKSRARNKTAKPGKPSELRALWKCPKCGKSFVTKNVWHSCRTYALESLFARSEPHVFQIYKKFETMVKACGPVIVEPRKNAIAFMARVRTIGFTPFKSHARLGLAFERPEKHRRFVKVVSYSRTFHAHNIDIHRESELDAEVQKWVQQAYDRSVQGAPKKKR